MYCDKFLGMICCGHNYREFVVGVIKESVKHGNKCIESVFFFVWDLSKLCFNPKILYLYSIQKIGNMVYKGKNWVYKNMRMKT